MCENHTPWDSQPSTIDREISRFIERHPGPLTLLKSRYNYHRDAAADKIQQAKKKRVSDGSFEIYLRHKQLADEYEAAIKKLEADPHGSR
jgi:hypothetical protein